MPRISLLRKLFVLCVAVAIGLICLPRGAQAGTITVGFSFTTDNTSECAKYSGDCIAGTVTGEIVGLPFNGTGSASEVLITSFPSGLDSVLGSAPINAMLWSVQGENSFNVTDGVITGGGFWATDTIGSFVDGAQLYINGDPSFNFLNLDGTDSHFVWAEDGIGASGVTFTSSATATPEPSSLLLLATGLLGLGFAVRRFALA